jgi:hypothetical protein
VPTTSCSRPGKRRWRATAPASRRASPKARAATWRRCSSLRAPPPPPRGWCTRTPA